MSDQIKNLEKLIVSEPIRKDLKEFLSQILELYEKDLLSIIVYGSCLSGDFNIKSSDINMIVVYSDLNIADLNQVSKISQKWAKKRNFAPRFLSKRNLINSSKFFQIDILNLKESHEILYGTDLIQEIKINNQDLHWQLSYEFKKIRLRIKQQYWRCSSDKNMMRNILIARFISISHLTKVLLYLKNYEMQHSLKESMLSASKKFDLSEKFILKMFNLKAKSISLDINELRICFQEIMDLIRSIDNQIDEIKL